MRCNEKETKAKQVNASREGRDTPNDLRREVRLLSLDSVALILGCIGLALSFPPLIYASALFHLIAGFSLALSKVFWVIIEPVTIAFGTLILMGGVYVVQVYYFGATHDAVLTMLRDRWHLMAAVAVVAGGIVRTLFAYPGTADELREHVERSGI